MKEFKKFQKIKREEMLYVRCSQKINGTNCHVVFDNGKWLAASKNRYLKKDSDHFGFYRFVEENYIELFNILGPGTHYGEWCGKGIQNGEGLSNRHWVLFSQKYVNILNFTKKNILENHICYKAPIIIQGRPVDFRLKTVKEIENKALNFISRGSFFSDCPAEGIITQIEGESVFYKSYVVKNG